MRPLLLWILWGLMKKIVGLTLLIGATTFCRAEAAEKFLGAFFNQGAARIINDAGKVEWEMKGLPSIQDVWVLENGNFLFSYKTGVKEVSKDKKVVWEYKSPADVELYSVQPIDGNKVLACECGTKRLIEIERGTGKITKEIALKSPAKRHTQFRSARKAADGTYWVAYLEGGYIQQLNDKGEVLKKIDLVKNGVKHAHSVRLLENGNILTSTAIGGGIKEFNSAGELVWEVTKEDFEAAGFTTVKYVGGVERLPNGNTIGAMYGGNPQFFEITPDKKMVWKYHNPTQGNVAGITFLD